MSRRVSFSYDVNDMPIIYQKYGDGSKADGNKKKVNEIWSFGHIRKSKFSLSGFLRRTGAKATRALRCMSSRKRCSRKVSSASLARSHSYAETLDSQRVEAIEDCIEFLNSSLSLQRSNSVTSSC
ncbi:uncharacterized protein LOC111373445 [Olea europaea var. sylvestris]|uniref:Josephin-like protein n=1 Tax=Olea europaea subsp. europaea TaxID=158383 RepID=A0A8S0U509_OLEEU|nr:uncharacterized protein LOC111373445 [Olea europaea var. sylvestris]CAA3011477.1 Hypothetical predicted protein [Olea europaea subsp. europaea]